MSGRLTRRTWVALAILLLAIPALMAQDVKLAVGDRLPIHTCLTTGGVIVDADEVVRRAICLAKGE